MAVLLVHGIWDTPARMAPLASRLEARGLGPVKVVDLKTRGGRESIAALARVVAREANVLADETGVDRIDLVGFSMGALVSRHYLQRGGGKERVRRFISISGPQHGTLTAYGLPFPAFPGVCEMRPGSDLLRDLESDRDPFGPVEVHCVYTPFDLMIVPATSSRLAGSRSIRSFPVAMHRFMLSDRRVLDHVAHVLSEERSTV